MKGRLTAYCVAIGLLATTTWLLHFSPAPVVSDAIGIRRVLPDELLGLQADSLRYCHNDQCVQRAHRVSKLNGRDACPACEGTLHDISLGEELLLPRDTEIIRRVYRSHGQDVFFVTIAVSGTERRSIHLPQICLVSQGNTIVNQRVVDIPLAERHPLEVTLLDLQRGGGDDSPGDTSCFAYWFVTEGRETPKHIERLFWMAWDGVVHNTRRRWAYISVATHRSFESDEHVERVRRFLAELHPLLAEGAND
jgi:hypothetical protein